MPEITLPPTTVARLARLPLRVAAICGARSAPLMVALALAAWMRAAAARRSKLLPSASSSRAANAGSSKVSRKGAGGRRMEQNYVFRPWRVVTAEPCY